LLATQSCHLLGDPGLERRLYNQKDDRSRPYGHCIPTMATTETDLPALASPAPTAAPLEADEVEYPEGNWIAQSISHGDAVRQAATALHHHLRERQDVLVAMELMVYYQRGNNKAKLQPDVQVVFGVRRGDRSSFRVWEEGKAPDFVLEVASPSTQENDAEHKAREYARIGVREYWRLDPQGSLLESPLVGYELSAGQYEPLQPVEGTGRGGALRSRVLGLELRSQKQDGATVLVFRDPCTGEAFDGALAESERRRRAAEEHASTEAKLRRVAEERASAEAKLRRAAEERVRALEERLRALKAHAPPAESDPS